MPPAPRILIVGPSWVGDMVMAQSLFLALKQRHPHCAIDVLAPAWTLPLLQRMPEVARGVAMPLGHGQFGFGARRQLGLELRGRYDWAIVLPNSWKSALTPFFAKIPKRTGYVGELRYGLLNDARKLDKAKLPKTVQRFVALGLEPDAALPPECPVPRLRVPAEGVAAVRAKFNVPLPGGEGTEKVLALCPGAEYGPAKRWPAAYFAKLARNKMAQGWSVWLFGSGKDQAVAEEIAAAAPGCVGFAGRTDLAEAVDLLSLADAAVSNDSGLMHVAAALEKPLVAIYGSSDPGFTPPLNAQARIVRLGLECSPCFKRDCPLGHTRCLTDISPEQVSAQLDALLPPAP
ncbi:lipopolysaccharide heptosyltransferase II [Methylogaea oryzae]|uniref:lipopolysaccharide heptosyltransferase II n=2 Tax=Methylogaea oryzae TaxID=1295382 RepID=A0A8D4VLA5_9GAMM|nr:lipopolysaccharide heptosyltransferase II [Methylogaea oryzae]BBL69622.1 heptosyltransferase II [Methylogaea oryzae]